MAHENAGMQGGKGGSSIPKKYLQTFYVLGSQNELHPPPPQSFLILHPRCCRIKRCIIQFANFSASERGASDKRRQPRRPFLHRIHPLLPTTSAQYVPLPTLVLWLFYSRSALQIPSLRLSVKHGSRCRPRGMNLSTVNSFG